MIMCSRRDKPRLLLGLSCIQSGSSVRVCFGQNLIAYFREISAKHRYLHITSLVVARADWMFALLAEVIVLRSIPYFQQTQKYSMPMPNAANIGIDFPSVLLAYIVISLPGTVVNVDAM